MTFIIVSGGTVTVTPMGMNKTTPNQELPGSTNPAKVVGWAPRGGFGETVISGDALIANGPGAVVVRWGAAMTGNLQFNEQRKFELMRNDAPVSSVSSAADKPALPAVPLTLAPGDRIWMRIVGSSFYANSITGGTNTYIYFELAP